MKKLVYEILERPLVQASYHRPNITPKVSKNLGQGHCFSTLLHIVQQLTRAERDLFISPPDSQHTHTHTNTQTYTLLPP